MKLLSPGVSPLHEASILPQVIPEEDEKKTAKADVSEMTAIILRVQVLLLAHFNM